MENQHHYQLFNYLLTQQIPTTFTSKQTQQLINQSKNYTIQNNLLYKKNSKNPKKLYRVIRKEELPAILYMFHNDPTSGHFATEAMFNKIKERYYWPQYYEDIRQYVESCDACQRRGQTKSNSSTRLAYWKLNAPGGERYLKELGLDRRPAGP